MYAFIKRVAVTTWPVAVAVEVEFSTVEVTDDTYNHDGGEQTEYFGCKKSNIMAEEGLRQR